MHFRLLHISAKQNLFFVTIVNPLLFLSKILHIELFVKQYKNYECFIFGKSNVWFLSIFFRLTFIDLFQSNQKIKVNYKHTRTLHKFTAFNAWCDVTSEHNFRTIVNNFLLKLTHWNAICLDFVVPYKFCKCNSSLLRGVFRVSSLFH